MVQQPPPQSSSGVPLPVGTPLRTLRFLFANAFFEIDPAADRTQIADFGGAAQPEPSSATRSRCAARFFSLLGETAAAASSVGSARSARSPGGPASEGVSAAHAAGHRAAEGAAESELALLDEVQGWWSQLAALSSSTIVQPASTSTGEDAATFTSRKALDAAATSARGEALALIEKLKAARADAANAAVHKQMSTLELLTHHLVLQLLVQPKVKSDRVGAA
eukprot:1081399-Pleurochrysis_carterae.AAC.1